MERLRLSGEIDLITAPWQLEKLAQRVESDPDAFGGSVEIDCSDLQYIDSTGLKMLVTLQERTGKRLVLVGLSTARRAPFTISGLDQVFELR
jgi:anti-anti-sigma factor